jgi:predicted AlkP superfamily pyrophosphatase or phosphodiesterase
MRSALLFVCFLPWLAAQRPVVVIGIDGLASSAVRNGATPEMDALIRNGTWTLRARGVMPTVSSPNWASIISGAGPEEHGVTSNEWERDRRDFTPVCTGRESIFPTLFGQLREAKPAARIYVFHDWDGFGRLVERGVADRLEHHKGSPATVDAALAAVKSGWPDLLFLHLDDVDHAGHEHGWGSPQYVDAVRRIDELVGRVRKALPAGAALLITSDHGGAGKKHGGNTMGELEIPWILTAPGVAANREVTAPVSAIDTAPTLARLLGIAPHACWRGRAVDAAFTTPSDRGPRP